MTKVGSEKRLALLIERAKVVFGSKEKATRWMAKSNRELDGLTPTDIATKDDQSAEQVENLLKRIESGYF